PFSKHFKAQNMKFLSLWSGMALSALLLASACSKKAEITPASSSKPAIAADPDQLVPTPGGPLPRSHVHRIPKGFSVLHYGNHLYRVETKTRNIIEDFGEVDAVPVRAKAPVRTNSSKVIPGTIGDSWVTWAEATFTGSTPITNFSTSFTVPNLPATDDRQTLFIYSGLQNASSASDIIQPI